jgi:predicted transcriptional regulator
MVMATDFELDLLRERLAEAEAGKTVDHEDVCGWLMSWGTANELPPPKIPSS